MRCASLAMAVIGLAGWAVPAAEWRSRAGIGSARARAGTGWLGSLEQGKAAARKTGKPLMVVIRCVP